MSLPLDSAPIATVEQFKAALKAVKNGDWPESHLEMLRAQFAAPDHTITATQLAKAAKFHNYNGANLQYGTMASHFARELGYTPPVAKNGDPNWWHTLSNERPGPELADDGELVLIMRPELVAALRELKWVRVS